MAAFTTVLLMNYARLSLSIVISTNTLGFNISVPCNVNLLQCESVLWEVTDGRVVRAGISVA